MVKKVVLISTGQPATNPRLVKEADSLQKAGYEVTVLYCYCIQWASDFDRELLKTVSWNYQLVGGSPGQNQWLYFFTRGRAKLAKLLNQYLGPTLMAENAQARAFDELLRAAKKIKADLYVGHNLGALAVAVKAANFNKAKAAFDFEDYHRGEFAPSDYNTRRIAALEKKYVHCLAYYSTSSPLIAEAVMNDHPEFKGTVLQLLNCFPQARQLPFHEKRTEEEKLTLFWFSQTIGRDRGLETVIAALRLLNNSEIELTLVGRCDSEMQEYIQLNSKAISSTIHFKGLIEPNDLIAFASQFDIGLACEQAVSVNRDLCLTNKIFTYILAGNAILASDTKAQAIFLNRNSKIGLLFQQNNEESLAQQIMFYKNNRAELRLHRMNAHVLAKEKLNWERESRKLIDACGCLL